MLTGRLGGATAHYRGLGLALPAPGCGAAMRPGPCRRFCGVQHSVEDDAYVLRFSRIVLAPLKEDMRVAAPALNSPRATALAADLESGLTRLDLACREKASDKEPQRAQT